MPAAPPDTAPVAIKHARARLTRATLDRSAVALLLLPPQPGAADWRALPYSNVLKKEFERARRSARGEANVLANARLGNDIQTHVGIAALRDGIGAHEQLTQMRKLVAVALEREPAEILLASHALDERSAAVQIEAAVAALLAAAFELPRYKSKPDGRTKLKSIRVISDVDWRSDRVLAEASGNNLARWLTALPGNELTPAAFRRQIEALAKMHRWQVQFYDQAALEKRKAGAFLAVARGSENDEAGIVRLRYRPRGAARKPAIALVGKGICFDTGGTNLKPFKSMLHMHIDMGGSAVALGVLLALSELGVEWPIDCWLAITENRIGPKAYKSQDVVTAGNGTTIQVIHTDAEGRMVLADTLVLASAEQPQLIIDYATLTGSCVAALTTRYTGAFTNRAELNELLLRAGTDSGERVWPFPMDGDYDSDLESSVADVLQCSTDSDGDHILASRFLQRFVGTGIPWVHLDLASVQRKGGLGHVPTELTGFGVRYTLNLLLDQALLERIAKR